MRAEIDNALNTSPMHRPALEQAIAGLDTDKELDRTAALLGRAAKNVGLTDMANPFNAKTQPAERLIWDRWFRAGYDRGEEPPRLKVKENDSRDAEVAALHEQLATARGEIAAEQARVKELESMMTGASAALTEAETLIGDLNRRVTELETENKGLKSRVAELETALANTTEGRDAALQAAADATARKPEPPPAS